MISNGENSFLVDESGKNNHAFSSGIYENDPTL